MLYRSANRTRLESLTSGWFELLWLTWRQSALGAGRTRRVLPPDGYRRDRKGPLRLADRHAVHRGVLRCRELPGRAERCLPIDRGSAISPWPNLAGQDGGASLGRFSLLLACARADDVYTVYLPPRQTQATRSPRASGRIRPDRSDDSAGALPAPLAILWLRHRHFLRSLVPQTACGRRRVRRPGGPARLLLRALAATGWAPSLANHGNPRGAPELLFVADACLGSGSTALPEPRPAAWQPP